MKKRLLSVILTLALALCLGLLPAVSPPASAATDTGKAIQLVDSGTAANISGGQADSIYFGTYKQSSDESDGYNTEPIKWRVLQNADGKLFLLADQILDAQQYYTSYSAITWENSTLRTWLNGTESGNFYADAFAEKEQAAIAETTVKNADGNTYDTGVSAGADTTDKVFALSEAEAVTTAYGFTDSYLATDTREAIITEYALSRGVHQYSGYDTGVWWLRSPGNSDSYAATVLYNGYLFDTGEPVSSDIVGVRPAFNLDLSSVFFTSAADNTGHNSSFAAPTGYSGSEWKATLKDGNDFLSGASVDKTDLTAGETLTVSHVALNTFADAGYTNVTAALTNSGGELLYYGSINDGLSATSSTVTIPAELAGGEYTLSVYGEDWNGENCTDYATGTPFTTTITVQGHSWKDMPDDGQVCTDCGYILYNIWVGGVQVGGVPDENGNITMTGNTITAGTVTLTPAGAVEDDPDTRVLENAPTLTLSGASITAAATPVDVAYGNTPPCGAYSRSALNLVLTGESTITASTTDYSAGVMADARDLAISGGGSLEINNCGYGIKADSLVTDDVTIEIIGSVYAISLNTGCTIEDSTVSAVGSNQGISTINGTIGIDNSSVYAEGGNYSFYGTLEGVAVDLVSSVHVKAEGTINIGLGVNSSHVGYLRTESGGEFAGKEGGSLETGSGYFEYVGAGHLSETAEFVDKNTHSYSCACAEESGMRATNVATEAHDYQYAPPGTSGYNYFAEVCKASCGHSATANVNLPALPSSYDGNPKEVTVEFDNNWAGEKNVTVAYYDASSNKLDAAPINAGSYTASITVNGATYSGQNSTFTISPVSISNAAITLGGALTYNGQAQTMAVSKVEIGGLTLAAADYTVSGNTGTNATSYTLTVTAKEGSNFIGEATTTWSIAKAPLTITAANQVIPQGGEIDQTKYLVSGLMEGHTVEGVKLTSDSIHIAVDTTNVRISDAGGTDVTGNYSISLVGGGLTTTDKTIVDIELLIPANLTYNGTDLSDGILITATANGEEVTAIDYDIAITDAQGSLVDEAVNAGKYMVEVSVVDTDENYAGTATYAFTIGKATPTGAPAYTKLTTSGKTLAEAGLTIEGGTFSVPGSVAWELPETTTVAANTAYKWVFTPADTVNYNTLTGSVTLYSVSAGEPYTPPVTSVTVPISGDEETINVDASVSGSKATVDDVDLSKLDTVIGEDVNTGVVTIDFSTLNKDIDTVEIPSDVVKQIAEAVNDPNNDAESLEVVLSDGTSIEFDAAALGEKAAQADGLDITISIESSKKATLTAAQENAVGGNTAYDINVTSGGKAISDMGGKITVHAPYELRSGEIPRGVVVYYVDENGSKEACETSYDVVRKRVNWKTDHLSLYMIGYDEELAESCPKDETCPMAVFTDVDVNAWYHDGVHYATQNGLMKGTGTTENLFSPNGTTTRAQIVTILHRLEGEPICGQGKSGTFGDVPDYQWYTEAVEWAAAYGIVEGYGDAQQSFGPNDPITREQLAAFLYRYAQHKGGGFTGLWAFRLEFEDVAALSDWAYEPMCWCVMNGIITGKPGDLLDPQGNATRAEAATMLMRFCELDK